MRINYRPDFTNALIHLTRKRTGKTPYHFPGRMFDTEGADVEVSAFDVLKEIVTANIIYGSTPEVGFIKGGHSAVCFSEVPFSGLKYMIQNGSRYETYGVILGKHSVYENGGRPVIYLPDDESDWIPKEEKWRHVRYESGKIDFTFEREWRIKGDLDLNKTRGFYLLVKTMKERTEIEALVKSKNRKCTGIFIFDHMTQMF